VASIEAYPGTGRGLRAGLRRALGDDATARETVAAGARGAISVTANVEPEAMARKIASALRGEEDEAERIDASLAALHQKLFVEANPIPVKWALAQLGRIPAGIRLPLTELSAAQQPLVRRALKRPRCDRQRQGQA
jgi:4-hydroxy-tetrahydrodipicolinate synthase